MINIFSILFEDNENFIFRIKYGGLSVSFFQLLDKSNGKVVSSATGQYDKRFNDIMSIGNVETEPEYRRKGLGFMLLRNITDFARKKECKRLCLNVMKYNQKAINLYKKLGFKISEEDPMAYLMELPL